MTLLPPGVKVHLVYGYTDMRKEMDGLALLVQDVLHQDPFSGHLFLFRGRKADRPAAHIEHFKGISQVDGYAGFETLGESEAIALAACWAHTRRKLYEFHQATGLPTAAEALRRTAELYAVEKTIRGRPAKARQRARQAESRPLIEAMKPWLEDQLRQVPPRGGLADAIRYALARWPALCRFLEDSCIELDNNPIERAIRSVALGRKNHLFAGSDGGGVRWAMVCSLIATRHRALRIPPRRAPAHGRQSSHQPARRPPAVELEGKTRQPLTDVQRSNAYPRDRAAIARLGFPTAERSPRHLRDRHGTPGLAGTSSDPELRPVAIRH